MASATWNEVPPALWRAALREVCLTPVYMVN
jgi:hypothetical protein